MKKKIKLENNKISIELPVEWVGKEVEITVYVIEKEKSPIHKNLFQYLFKEPIATLSFIPLTRDEIYGK